MAMALLPDLLGCAAARRPVLAASDQFLLASLQVDGGPALVGARYDVTIAVLNTGNATLKACFGDAFEVTFRNASEARGYIDTVDHPPCAKKFVLLPGEESTRVYSTIVPSISEGPAELTGGVQIVDPTHCDRYGCDATWVKFIKHPQVVVKHGTK